MMDIIKTDLKLNQNCELINITPLKNPLISHCKIKVLYVSDEPNRNGTVITKETALEIAKSLPGSPIVGFYNEETQDFEGHEEALYVEDGELKFKSLTKPYGFVDLGAKVWFENFDDNGVEHEYLVTEGYLWTGQYPEAQRILEKGNNQSMELSDVNGFWTDFDKQGQTFFIINEAIISKLCILGENVEPCFEGAQIVNFSLNQNFEDQILNFTKKMSDMIEQELKQNYDKGGADMIDEKSPAEEQVLEEVPEVQEFAENKKEDETEEEICPECGKPLSECVCKEKDEEDEVKTKHSLDEEIEVENNQEIDELNSKYEALQTDYEALQQNYSSLEEKYNNLVAENKELCNFKLKAERKEKENMINQFYMLSDEDKKEVVDNIDTYSLDDIEAKLSVICVRNRVNFSAVEEKNEDVVFTDIHGPSSEVPDWVAAVRKVQQEQCY